MTAPDPNAPRPAEPGGPVLTEVIEKARQAVSALRDAARAGRAMDHWERDPLVMAIHEAIDLAECVQRPPVLSEEERADLLRFAESEEGWAAAYKAKSEKRWRDYALRRAALLRRLAGG